MKKPSLGSVPPQLPLPHTVFLSAVKENIETITGRRGGRIEQLADDAVLADVISKINEMLTRYQE